jgi:hypothetical protein
MLTISYDEGLISSFTISGEDCDLLVGALYQMRQTDINLMPKEMKRIVELLLLNSYEQKP